MEKASLSGKRRGLRIIPKLKPESDSYLLSRERKIMRIGKQLIILFVGIVFHISWVNCEANQLIFGLDTTPDRLIPTKIKSPQTFPVSMQIYEGLFDLNVNGIVIPKIIQKWETQDFRTWTFHVREGVHFQKSPIFKEADREVTAEDILYSLTQFCSSDSYPAFLLTDSVKGAKEFNQGTSDNVSGLKVIDKYTLKIELVRPTRFFLNTISTAWICVFPKEMADKEFADKSGLSVAVGTGPYGLKSRTENEIVLEKNEHYWNKADMPKIDKIVFKVINNDQTRFVNLQRGNIDMMVLPSVHPEIEFFDSGKRWQNSPSSGILFCDRVIQIFLALHAKFINF